jgi:choline dehydrogenase-like flavoprotein
MKAAAVNDHDVIVVGSGFAGSWAAKELAEAGFRTLVLEAGPAREAHEVPDRAESHAGSGNAEQNWHRQDVQRRHDNFGPRGPHLFVDDLDHPYRTPESAPYNWIRGMQVGGRSLIWGGSALRLSQFELQATEIDCCRLSWPIRYEQLAENYALVEEFMGLRGTSEGLPQFPDGRYRDAPPALTPAERDFYRSYRRGNTRPVPVRFVPADPGTNGWPGFTMQARVLAAAQRTGRVVLRPDSFVSEVTTDPVDGRATGVRYVDTTTGTWHHERARIVFLCAGTVETARLMLNSRGPRHPFGLGNSSGWLGRGLIDHPVTTCTGRLDGYPHASGHAWSGRQCGLIVPPPTSAADDVRPFALWVTLQRRTADGSVLGSIDAQGEMLPYWRNRIKLGSSRDRWGIPVPVIEVRYGRHEDRLYRAMRREIEVAASIAGMKIDTIAEGLTVPGQNVHDLGTARMGTSSAESVLDPDNRCWDSPNVFVADGACFPSGGWQNPTLTIMALAARAGRFAAGMLSEGVY